MSLMQRATRAVEQRSFWARTPWPRDAALARLIGSERTRTTAGIQVDYEMAFTCAAVYDAVNQLSHDVAKLPLNLMKRRPGGRGADPYVGSPLYRMLKYAPNPEMGSLRFRRQIMIWALTDHGGYAEIQRDGVARPVALWPVAPHRVRPYRPPAPGGARDAGPIAYDIDNGRSTIAADDMLHIAGIGYDAHYGYSVIHKACRAIGLALAAEQFGAAFFGNGSTFGGILSTPAQLSPQQQQELRAALEGLHQGPDRAHRFAVLWGALQYQKIGVAPDEAQMNELRSKQVEEVARFFNMPVHKLKNLDRATNNNIEQQDLEYYKGPVLNWVIQFEEEMNRKLIPPLELNQQFIKHNMSAVLRADMASRFASYSIALDKGLYSRNEIRALEDMNPQEDASGDAYLVQQAQIPIDLLPALAQSQIDLANARVEAIKRLPAKPPAADSNLLGDANARAERAEAAAAEARDQVETLRERLAQLETGGADARAECERVRADLTAALDLSAQLTLLSAEAQRAADQARQNSETAAAALAAARLEADDAAARADQAAAETEAARQHAAAAAESLEEARRRAAEADAERHLHATALEAERAGLSSRLADAEKRHLALVAERDAQIVALTAQAQHSHESADRAVSVAQAMAEAAIAERDALVAAREAYQAEAEGLCREASAAAEAARAEAVAASVRADQAAAELEAARQEAVAAAAALEEARRGAAEAERRAGELTDQRDSLHEQLRTAQDGKRHAEQLLAQENERVITAEGAREVAAAAVREAEEKAERCKAEQTQLAKEAEDARTDANSAREAANRAEAELKQAQADATRALDETRAAADRHRAAVMAAHREMVADVMSRMVAREVDRIRTARVSPSKLRTVMTTFYEGFTDLCTEALVPSMRVHLAWLGSDEDPAELAGRLAAAHVAESVRQLQAALEADPVEAFGQVLDQTLRRWDRRAAAVADAILQTEIDVAGRDRS